MEIAEQIRTQRVKHGLTQQELATKAGLALDTISRLENKKNLNPTIYVLRQISQALNYYKFEL